MCIQALQSHSDLIGAVAAIATIGLIFTGYFICLEVHRKKSTKDISPVPFVGGLVVGLGNLKYGFILQNNTVIIVNVCGVIINTCFCIFYSKYSADKWNDILKKLAIAFGIVAFLWGYADWEDPSLIEFRYGLLMTALQLLLTGFPLLNVRQMIAKKDASSIPFELTAMATLVSFLWLLYGIAIANAFVVVQNIMSFTLGFTQLVLIFIYPRPAGASEGAQ